MMALSLENSRAPHGARGLKFHPRLPGGLQPLVAPRTGRVD